MVLSDEAAGRWTEALMGLDLEQQVTWPWNQLKHRREQLSFHLCRL